MLWGERRGHGTFGAVQPLPNHPTSIAVSREHRRAKTDRLDTELLMRALVGWLRARFQGAAAALGITTQTVFDYLARGLLMGHQLTKGQPWQIELTDERVIQLRARVRHNKRSKKEAS
jgi:hypothetical protein